jgi:hypothetical protein
MKRNLPLNRPLLTALLVVLSLRPSFSPAATLSGSEGIDLCNSPSGLIDNGKAISLANDLGEADWAGAFSASLLVPAASFINTSDRRLKENIKPTHYGLDAVLKMRVVDYRYKADPKKPHTGFIAQDLHQVYPEAVTVGGENVKTQPWGVDYAKLTPLLTKAVQEQQQQIETLTQDKAAQAVQIAALKKQQAAEITTLQAALEELHQFEGLKTTPRQAGRKATASR